MTLHFRPFAGFTLLCALLFTVLICLGVWQLERMRWKLALISQMSRNMTAPAISLDAALELGIERAQYHRVILKGHLENRKESYLYTTGPSGGPVYHVLTPLKLDNGAMMLIDRGYVPLALRDPASRPGSEPQSEVTITGIWRMPDRSGPFTPAPDLPHRVWFSDDFAGIARVENLRFAAPAIIEAAASPRARAWPRAGQTRIMVANDHLEYALTWFLLAAALLVVYIAYHSAQGRLALGAGR